MHGFFTNLNMNIKNLLLDFKQTCMKNKLIVMSLIVAVILSMLFSIDNQLRIKAMSTYSGNIIILIKNKEFNLFLHTLKITFFLALIYAFLLFARFHFALFIGNFGFAIIFIRMLFKMLFLAFIFDGFFALIYFLFFWLPLFCYALISYFILMCKIYNILGFTHCKSRPLCCPSGKTYFMIVVKGYFNILIPILAYNFLFILVINLIY